MTTQPDLFAAAAAGTAVLSECGTYRYRLDRVWNPDLRPACWVMLNPSTATAVKDDPTVRRCVAFSKAWGAGGIVIVNLFALRSADPRQLQLALDQGIDPVGPDNDRHIVRAVAEGHPVVCAWGVNGGLRGRDAAVRALIRRAGLPWGMCLGATKDGHPRHPLYVKGCAVPEPYRRPDESPPARAE